MKGDAMNAKGMDALTLLTERVSCPALCEPAPSAAQLDIMLRAALRAPDHAHLRPYRFLTVAGEDRNALGDLFLRAAKANNPDLEPERLGRFQRMSQRAPLLLVVIACLQEHPNVPKLEQQITAGAAAHAVIQAAYAQGLGAMWRTGDLAYNPVVAEGLGLADHEQVIGFIYLGHPGCDLKAAPQADPAAIVSAWSGA